MGIELWLQIFWVLAIFMVIYLLIGHILTKHVIGKSPSQYPTVGIPWAYTPRFIHNLAFAKDASKLVQYGYKTFKNGFQLVRNRGNIIVLPLSVLDELANIPSNIATPNGALEHDLLGQFTGLNLILDSRMHHTIVQRKLTPRLSVITPALENEIVAAFHDYFPKTTADNWTEFEPYQVLGKISARLASRAIVGPAYCRDPVWLDVAFNYTENLILRLLPDWTHSLICWLLPSFWNCRKYLVMAKKLLGPKTQELLELNDKGTWKPEMSNEEDMNVLNWLIDASRGRDRDAGTIAHVQVLLALASVHTTLLRMVNVLYDLTENGPELSKNIQSEIDDVANSPPGWTNSAYDNLFMLDSVLRESQRMSPPTTLGMKRYFKEPYTFENGIFIPKETYACMATYAIENDPDHTTHPDAFDGLRAYRALIQSQQEGQEDRHAKDFLFSSTGRTVLNFGYGKTACPGRFFASLILKMVFVKLLSGYDFQFMDGKTRPSNYMIHEFLFCWPWQKVLVKSKKTDTCPF